MDSAVELIAYLMTGLQRWHLNNFNMKQTFPKGRKGMLKQYRAFFISCPILFRNIKNYIWEQETSG